MVVAPGILETTIYMFYFLVLSLNDNLKYLIYSLLTDNITEYNVI